MDFGMEEGALVLRLPGPRDDVEGNKDRPAISMIRGAAADEPTASVEDLAAARRKRVNDG